MANCDLAEGVYAASGSTGTESGISMFLMESSGNTKTYGASFSNNKNERVDTVTVTVTVDGNVTSIDGNVTAQLNGDGTATISFNNYGKGFDANQTIHGGSITVVGTGNFGIR